MKTFQVSPLLSILFPLTAALAISKPEDGALLARQLPTCTPKSGTQEAVVNGGFSQQLNSWTYSTPSSDDFFYTYEPDEGVTNDKADKYNFYLQPRTGSLYTLTMSQTICLATGRQHTWSYYQGLEAQLGKTNGSPCKVAFLLNGVQLQAARNPCGAASIAPTSGTTTKIGACDKLGYYNDGTTATFYEKLTNRFTPTVASNTFTFSITCDYTNAAVANLPYLLDHVSIHAL